MGSHSPNLEKIFEKKIQKMKQDPFFQLEVNLMCGQKYL